jgi:uncharacterized membrane protein
MNLEQPTTMQPRATKKSDAPLLIGLILLSVIPVLGGMVRLTDLASNTVINPSNARFHTMPLPVVIHIIAATLFSILGAFQFAPNFRQKHLKLHRIMGRILVIAGILVGLTGLFMTVVYPLYPQLQGIILLGFRLLAGVGMLLSIILAWRNVVQGNIKAHRNWMIRAYAIAQGAGTQAIVFIPWTMLIGKPDALTRDSLMAVSWVINLAIAEWIIGKSVAKSK